LLYVNAIHFLRMCTAGIQHRGQWVALSNWTISVGSKSNGTWSVVALSNITKCSVGSMKQQNNVVSEKHEVTEQRYHWVASSNRTTWLVGNIK